jgi:peptide/nickel transport system substrate-binding protein
MNAVDVYYRGRPKIDRIIIRAYPTVRTAWAAMMRGDIDFLYEVGPGAVEFMRGEASVNVFSFLRSYLLGVILNSRKPVFNDWRVRRALNYAIDRETVVHSAFRGHGMAATGPAWPQHWAYDSTVPKLSYDPMRATALFDSASLPLKPHDSGLPSRLSFTAILPENFALWERMGLLVQRDLAKIGVDMQLETLSVTEFFSRIAAGNFDAILTEFVVGNSPSRPLTFWHSQSKRNVFGYTNPSMDSAFESMRRASNENEYRDGFRRFQIEGVENPPAIYLVLGEISRAVSKRIQVVAQPGNDILHTIADWQPAEISN